jgi:Flp pilus assembly protein TadB
VDQQTDGPVSITSARASRSAEINHRQSRYLFSMAIRTACFVGAVVTTGVLRWVLVAAAFVLPYVAVVMANTSERRQTSGPESFRTDDRPLLPGPDSPRTGTRETHP